MILLRKKLMFLILILATSFPCYAGEDVYYDGTNINIIQNLFWNGMYSAIGPSGINFPSGANSVSDNNIEINFPENSTPNIDLVFGGLRRDSLSVSRNDVFLENGKIVGTVYGGYSIGGDSTDNSVVFSDGSVGGLIIGGMAPSGSALGNYVEILGGSVGYDVYAGESYTGKASNNTLLISGGNIGRNVFGASGNSALIDSNTVFISGGNIGGRVYGGYTYTNGVVSNNSVIMSGGSVEENVFGGYSISGQVLKNNVIIEDCYSSVPFGGYSKNSDASYNSVYIKNGAIVSDVVGGQSAGGSATGNIVSIDGGSVQNSIYGGMSPEGSSNNIIYFNNGETQGSGWIYGGYSYGVGSANYNSVILNNGDVSGNIYGGYISSGSGDCNYNTISISDEVVLRWSPRILGGHGGGSGDYWTGNTLNSSACNVYVSEINNFEYYNFYISEFVQSGDTLIYILGENPTNLENAKISISGIAKGSALKVGDSITLINSTIGSPVLLKGLSSGLSFLYDIELSATDSLIATIIAASTNPNTKVFSEGRSAGHVFLNRGSELTQGKGIGALLASTQQQGLSAFGAFSGGEERVDTGSYVDVNGFSLLTGLGWGSDVGDGRLTLGAFFEAGMGGYDSHNSFSTGTIEGDGSTKYYGGGLTGRYDYRCGGYTEASMRAGFSRTDFESGDIVLNGNSADFETSAGYFGGHLGLGYKWDVTDSGELDLYTKWLWTHLEGDDVTVLGDPVKFKDSDSHRWRTGARFEYTLADKIKPYVGAAYEYEFDGEIEATADGSDIDRPSLKGGTGVGEIGVRLGNLLEDGDLSVDLGLQGSVGQREGMGGSFQLKWLF